MSSPTVTERIINVIKTSHNDNTIFTGTLLSKSNGASSEHTTARVIEEIGKKDASVLSGDEKRLIKVIETNDNGHTTFDAALLSKSNGASSDHTAEGVIAEMNNKGAAPTDEPSVLESRRIQTLENEEKQIQKAANANRLARIEENAKIHYGQLRNNVVEARAEMQAIRNTLNKSTNTAERDLLQTQLKAAQIKYTNAQQKFSTKKARIKERQNAENARIQERQKAENARIQERQKAENTARIEYNRKTVENADYTAFHKSPANIESNIAAAKAEMEAARKAYNNSTDKNEKALQQQQLEAAQDKYIKAQFAYSKFVEHSLHTQPWNKAMARFAKYRKPLRVTEDMSPKNTVHTFRLMLRNAETIARVAEKDVENAEMNYTDSLKRRNAQETETLKRALNEKIRISQNAAAKYQRIASNFEKAELARSTVTDSSLVNNNNSSTTNHFTLRNRLIATERAYKKAQSDYRKSINSGKSENDTALKLNTLSTTEARLQSAKRAYFKAINAPVISNKDTEEIRRRKKAYLAALDEDIRVSSIPSVPGAANNTDTRIKKAQETVERTKRELNSALAQSGGCFSMRTSTRSSKRCSPYRKKTNVTRRNRQRT